MRQTDRSPFRTGRDTALPGAPTADYPAKAYDRAVRAFDEYDACAAEYRVLLDTQRALLVSGNMDGALATLERGDVIARRAASCGRRIAPIRESLDGNTYAGRCATELRRRLASAGALAEQLSIAVTQIGAVCVVKRDEASAELGDPREAQQQRMRAAYGAPARFMAAIDIRR
jgi:hypothetical protein